MSRFCHLAVIPFIWLTLSGHAPARMRWAVYYADRAQPQEFGDYQLLVFDSESHPALEAIENRRTIVLGYLSVGEVERHRAWFKAVQQLGILLAENVNWRGSYFVDIRDARWHRIVTGKLLPEILAHGFQGVFLDTLDDGIELERREPQKYMGMAAASIALVKEIRQSFPSITLMMNRAYPLLPQLAREIDIALGESVYSTYDFNHRVYRRVPAAEYRQQIEWLKQAQKSNPALRICTLDYWNPADQESIRRIYREERRNGFLPYVASIGLDQLVKEPK